MPRLVFTALIGSRRSLRSRLAAGALLLLAVAWHPSTPAHGAQKLNIAPHTVRLFPHPDYVGVSVDYKLPPGQDFLLVPEFPAGIDDQVSSIAMGDEVGVVLFRDKGFAGKDVGIRAPFDDCSDHITEYSISKGVFKESQAVVEWRAGTNYADIRDLFDSPKTARGLGDAASSMVIYRREVGGMHAAELLNFGREFQLADAFEGGLCDFTRQFFPLSSLKGSECFSVRGWDTQWLVFHGGGPKRSIRVDLFDGDGCTGQALAFPDPMIPRRQFDLVAYGWENRTRSLQVKLFDPTAAKVAGAVPWVPEEPAWVEENRKRSGSKVIRSYWSSDNDPVVCQKACSAEGYCKSYSFAPFARMTAVEAGGFAKPEPHLCALNRDVPPLERADGNVSGVKSYAGATTLRFEKPTLKALPIQACSGPGGCDKAAALPYCQAQGLAQVESATWVDEGHFDQIICTNVVKAGTPPGSPAAPASPGSAPTAGTGVAAGLARCEKYARSAVQQQQQSVALKCGFPGPAWSDDYQHHYDWCATVNAEESEQGTQMREQMLGACLKAQDRPTQCDAYAKSALQDQQENLAKGCGREGVEWNSDYNWHYNWCLQVSAAQSDAGSALRRGMLDLCKK